MKIVENCSHVFAADVYPGDVFKVNHIYYMRAKIADQYKECAPNGFIPAINLEEGHLVGIQTNAEVVVYPNAAMYLNPPLRTK
jgi:hypothetical protein